jgi:hypothetical protein
LQAASDEQARGIEQVNSAVAEMDKVVQQNAAMAEESAGASEEMNTQTEQMNNYVAELVALLGSSTNGKKERKEKTVGSLKIEGKRQEKKEPLISLDTAVASLGADAPGEDYNDFEERSP